MASWIQLSTLALAHIYVAESSVADSSVCSLDNSCGIDETTMLQGMVKSRVHPHAISKEDGDRVSTEMGEVSLIKFRAAAGCDGTYEAEDATIEGGVEHANTASAGHQGFTGRSFVDYLHPNGDSVQWTVNGCRNGSAIASFRYALASGNRPLQVLVNGQEVASALGFPACGGGDWKTWCDVSVLVDFWPGQNTVKLVATGASGANMDSLTIAMAPAHPQALTDTKCPHNHNDRLFRAPGHGVSAITLEECFSECSATEGCNHFSYGPWQGGFVCMGCTTSDHAEGHSGFTLYDMPVKALTDMKCPHNHNDRVFRSPGHGASAITIEECFSECSATEGCNHFSYGPWQGGFVCMGCTTHDNAEGHSGFTLYDMPVAAPAYHQALTDTKCPINHSDRLFRVPGHGVSAITLEECFSECSATEACNHFSYGPWQGGFVCMGCTTSDHAEGHSGFTLYDMS